MDDDWRLVVDEAREQLRIAADRLRATRDHVALGQLLIAEALVYLGEIDDALAEYDELFGRGPGET